jgi:hypothetical protein
MLNLGANISQDTWLVLAQAQLARAPSQALAVVLVLLVVDLLVDSLLVVGLLVDLVLLLATRYVDSFYNTSFTLMLASVADQTTLLVIARHKR